MEKASNEMTSDVLQWTLHIDVPVLDDQEEHTNNSSV